MKAGAIERKPKIYGLAALTVLALAGMGLLALKGGEKGLVWGNLLLTVYFGAAVLCLVIALRRQLRYNLYSYNTILYTGFALFMLSLFVTHALAAVQSLAHPESFRSEQMLYTLVHSAKNYMFLTSPLLILFSAALLISNISLIRHEGRRFVNVLGILLALALTAGEAFIAFLDLRSAFSRDYALLRNLVVNLAAALYLYFECMMVGAAAAALIAARRIPARDKDFLIVLGCGLKKDGSPTPLLRGRLDLAMGFDRRQQEESGREAVYVCSGGQGPDEVQSEAASMRDCLLSQEIGEERILLEDRSGDTAENMRFSAELIRQRDPAAKTAFFTTNYHVFRAGLKARRAGLRAEGMGAPTRWYFWPNAAVREFVGLLTEHRGKQALVLLLLLAVYAVLTVWTYA